MKYITICLLLTFLFSCNKDFKPDFENGKAEALKNGTTWEGQARGLDNNQGYGVDMYYDVFNSEGFLRQRLEFTRIPKTAGSYALYNTFDQNIGTKSASNYITVVSDGDVTGDLYLIVEDEDLSFITVDSYDENTRWFRGTFQATYYFDPNRIKYDPNAPDTIKFEMGDFEVKLEE